MHLAGIAALIAERDRLRRELDDARAECDQLRSAAMGHICPPALYPGGWHPAPMPVPDHWQ